MNGPPPPDESTTPPESWFAALVQSAGIASLAGVIAGALWGGIGGRVAMRVLFLTTGDHVRGVTSDDGFEIGTISGATIFLIIFASFLGAIAGLLYGLLRMVTAGPSWLVAIGVTVATAAGAGASIVHHEGVDFRFLDPLWLTIGLFVFLPGAWALTVVLLTKRLMQPGTLFAEPPARIHETKWGAVGWLVLVAMATLGVVDLVGDVDLLQRVR